MSQHINGGAKFSQLVFDVFADGKPTGIARITNTDGSPLYVKTLDKLEKDGEEFDVLATRGDGMIAWLEAHHTPAEEPSK